MIATHFQLREEPFQKRIPEGGLFRSRGFEEGASRLAHLLATDGIGLLVGETGCGKSTLLREVDRLADPGRMRICYVSFTSLRSFGFLVQLGALLGVGPKRFKGEMAKAILDALAGVGRKTLLIVDEAHRLPDDTLEDLRLLTTSDFDTMSAFTLVLCRPPTPRETAVLVGVYAQHPHSEDPGTIRGQDDKTWLLFCRGGSVVLDRSDGRSH